MAEKYVNNATQHIVYTKLLSEASQTLRAAGIADPMRDARLLLAHAIGISNTRLTLVLQDIATPKAIENFHSLIAKRTARQPVSQLLGAREFWGRRFKVTLDVLDPRPDTELLVETALEVPFRQILDLGTGSGCILISLLCERPETTGTGVDISSAALNIATENAASLAVASRATFQHSDWFENVEGRFDLIVANPPYVTASEYKALAPELRLWEPEAALTPGGDGLSAYRTIAAGAASYLRPDGHLIVEIGATQADAVQAIFQAAGFKNCTVKSDLNNHNRVVSARFC